MKQQEVNKLLDDYRLGTISIENRRLLEQIAIEDDFVFDALQGMESARSSSTSKSMDVLRTRLEDRVKTQKKRKILPFWIPGAAAAILVVVTAFWLLDSKNESFKNNTSVADASLDKEERMQENNHDVSINESYSEGISKEVTPSAKPKTTINKPSSTPPVEKKKIEEQNRLVSANTPMEQSTPPPIVESKLKDDELTYENEALAGHAYSIPESVDDMVMEDAEEEVQAIIAQEESFDMDAAGDLNSEYSPERATPPAQASSIKKKSRASAVEKVISKDEMLPIVYQGIVTDQYGEPLIGANLEIKGTNIGVITNIDGIAKFMNVPVENPRIIVSYTGYNSVEIPLKNDFKVQLHEGATLSEVVVVGLGNNDISEPEIGWDKFNDLVKTQMESIALNQEQNDEIIQIDFAVGSNGVPENIEIIKGKGNPKSMALIQLIQTCGKWRSGKGSYSY